MRLSILRTLAMIVALIVSSLAPAAAASLSVSPIRLDVVAPGNGGRVSVRNASQGPINIQVRIFRWSAKNNDDDFQETQQVVASPPFARVPANGEIEVRVLRVGGGAIAGEEAYRLVIDEVPDANRIRNIGVNVAIRYALPVFFFDAEASPARLTWGLRMIQGRPALVASNSGAKHIRIADLGVNGSVLIKGLAGYVLGNSTRAFLLPASARPHGRVTALSDEGRVDAPISP